MNDLISRTQAIDALKEKVFHNLSDEFYGAMQVLDELPSAQPDTTTHDSIPAETGKNDGDGTSGDCISRQQAIDALLGITAMRNTIPLDSAVFNIKKLPSAQPKQEKGRWTIKNGELAIWDVCSECKKMVLHKAPFYNYCPNCGADMRPTERETE